MTTGFNNCVSCNALLHNNMMIKIDGQPVCKRDDCIAKLKEKQTSNNGKPEPDQWRVPWISRLG